MMNKYLILGVSMIGAFLLGVMIFSTCNPISNKCYASDSKDSNIVLVKNLSPQDFKNKMNVSGYKILDIRTSSEFNSGYIKGAENIDFYKTQEFSNYLDRLDKNGKYLIYCRSGNRSGQALSMMKAKGFTNVSDLDGGINAWISEGHAVEK